MALLSGWGPVPSRHPQGSKARCMRALLLGLHVMTMQVSALLQQARQLAISMLPVADCRLCSCRAVAVAVQVHVQRPRCLKDDMPHAISFFRLCQRLLTHIPYKDSGAAVICRSFANGAEALSWRRKVRTHFLCDISFWKVISTVSLPPMAACAASLPTCAGTGQRARPS